MRPREVGWGGATLSTRGEVFGRATKVLVPDTQTETHTEGHNPSQTHRPVLSARTRSDFCGAGAACGGEGGTPRAARALPDHFHRLREIDCVCVAMHARHSDWLSVGLTPCSKHATSVRPACSHQSHTCIVLLAPQVDASGSIATRRRVLRAWGSAVRKIFPRFCCCSCDIACCLRRQRISCGRQPETAKTARSSV